MHRGRDGVTVWTSGLRDSASAYAGVMCDLFSYLACKATLALMTLTKRAISPSQSAAEQVVHVLARGAQPLLVADERLVFVEQ